NTMRPPVIGERLVTPSAIVLLVVKLRMSSLADETKATISKDPEVADRTSKANDEKDYQFLIGRQDVEELPVNTLATGGWAHTPYWPEVNHTVYFPRSYLFIRLPAEPQTW